MMQIPIQIWRKYFIITHYRIKRHEPCNIVLVPPMNKVDLCSTTKPSKAAGENKRDSKKWAQSKLYESPPLLPKKVKKLRLSAFSSNSLMQHRETCTQRPSINRPVFEDFDFFLDKNTVIVTLFSAPERKLNTLGWINEKNKPLFTTPTQQSQQMFGLLN